MVKWFSRCPLLCTPPRLELGRTDSAILVVSGSYLDPESSDAHYFALGTGKQGTQTFVDTTHIPLRLRPLHAFLSFVSNVHYEPIPTFHTDQPETLDHRQAGLERPPPGDIREIIQN